MNPNSELLLCICGLILVCTFIFFLGASYFDAIPPVATDIGKWISENTLALVLAVCFVIGIYVYEHRKKGE
jgi:hypothetical protein